MRGNAAHALAAAPPPPHGRPDRGSAGRTEPRIVRAGARAAALSQQTRANRPVKGSGNGWPQRCRGVDYAGAVGASLICRL